jgi:AbiJ N-terminal domain 4
MALFSQRKGIHPMQKAVQKDSIDNELRNSLWSALYGFIYRNYTYSNYDPVSANIRTLFNQYWLSYFKLPSDSQPEYPAALERVRDYFFSCTWNEVYDFLEFTVKHAEWIAEDLRKVCNLFLERENSAYRFVGNEIAEITSDVEIKAVEDALSSGIPAVEKHLQTALSLLSDRKNPDYRNSIKESISAVEAICRLVSGEPKATLGPALKQVSAKTPLHPAFEKGLLALYGFTSDEHGIRHSLLEEPNLHYSDAKFMLVVASGFCSFVLAKCAENGIKIKGHS